MLSIEAQWIVQLSCSCAEVNCCKLYREQIIASASGMLTFAEVTQQCSQALLVVEAGQQKRHVSAPLRLAACFLSSLLAAPATASAQFDALDVKHILHDTISGEHSNLYNSIEQ